MHANLHINVIARSAGRNAIGASAYRSASAVACAAYRAGEKAKDDRYDKTHDYSKKQNVLHAEIITPEGAPEWMKDRQALWNAVEAGEKRKDARLAKEAVLVLPRNLDTEQHKEVVETFIRNNLTKHSLVADYAIHSPDASDGGKNPHAHVMFTLRPVEGDGFGKKLTGFKNVLDNPDTIPEWRKSYESILNEVSEKADSNIQFDLRSLKEKGIDREPQPKVGPKVKHMEERGYLTDWGQEVRRVAHRNNARAAYTHHDLTYTITHQTARAVDAVRDDIAYKYYEAAYGDNLHKNFYGNDERDRTEQQWDR
ncbi:MobQ family relaxase [Larkinella sp. C7]|uniref:MobQ family relaxase n=1 Tax=Larkinella sp. C7 TaxID=2576607 RepID=UPI0011110EB9|nr:MobQ family relaxase [Larkinella sp. C7]